MYIVLESLQPQEGEKGREANKSFFYHTLLLHLKNHDIIKTDVTEKLQLVKHTSLTSRPDRKHVTCSITRYDPDMKITKALNDFFASW